MDADKKIRAAGQLAKRLNDFFADDRTEAATQPPAVAPQGPATGLLADLDAIVLSIDWEISDEIMQGLIDEIENLKRVFSGDPIAFQLLQIHRSAACYVKARKASAHPDAIKLLHSVYDALASSLDCDDQERKKELLAREIGRLRALKTKLEPRKEKAPSRKPSPWPSPTTDTANDAVLEAIAELKQMIQEEFAALRRELAGTVEPDV